MQLPHPDPILPGTPVIRTARPDQAPLLRALAERAYAPYLPVLDRRPAPMDDDYARRVADGQAFVAEVRGMLAGLLVLVDEPGGVLLLDNIAVEPGFQGTGLGRALLRWVEEEAARRGASVLRLYTNERMQRNIALYERAGFRETHRLEQGGFRRVFMAKRLPVADAAGRGAAGQGAAGRRS